MCRIRCNEYTTRQLHRQDKAETMQLQDSSRPLIERSDEDSTAGEISLNDSACQTPHSNFGSSSFNQLLKV